MRVWIERVNGRYEVWYQLTSVSKSVRHRVCRTKSEAQRVSESLASMIRGGKPQGRG